MKRECSKVGTDPAHIQRGCEADIGREVILTPPLSLEAEGALAGWRGSVSKRPGYGVLLIVAA